MVLRPRFELVLSISAEELRRRVRHRLKGGNSSVRGLVAPDRIELHVPGNEQRMWSAQLVAELVERESGCIVVAHFGPHPSVWTMYVGLYAGLAFASLVGATFGYAQWAIDAAPWALLSIPATAFSALLLYLGARFGQELSREEMERLRLFLMETIEASASSHSPAVVCRPDEGGLPGS